MTLVHQPSGNPITNGIGHKAQLDAERVARVQKLFTELARYDLLFHKKQFFLADLFKFSSRAELAKSTATTFLDIIRLGVATGAAFIPYYAGSSFFTNVLLKTSLLKPHVEKLKGGSDVLAIFNAIVNTPLNFLSFDPISFILRIYDKFYRPSRNRLRAERNGSSGSKKKRKLDVSLLGTIATLVWLLATGLGTAPGWQMAADTLKQAEVDNEAQTVILETLNTVVMYFLNNRGAFNTLDKEYQSEYELETKEHAREFREKILNHLNSCLPASEKFNGDEINALASGKNTLPNPQAETRKRKIFRILAAFITPYMYCFARSASLKFNDSAFGIVCAFFSAAYRGLLLTNMAGNVIDKLHDIFARKIITVDSKLTTRAINLFRVLLAAFVFFTITNAANNYHLYMFSPDPNKPMDADWDATLSLFFGFFASFFANLADSDKVFIDLLAKTFNQGRALFYCREGFSYAKTGDTYQEMIKIAMFNVMSISDSVAAQMAEDKNPYGESRIERKIKELLKELADFNHDEKAAGFRLFKVNCKAQELESVPSKGAPPSAAETTPLLSRHLQSAGGSGNPLHSRSSPLPEIFVKLGIQPHAFWAGLRLASKSATMPEALITISPHYQPTLTQIENYVSKTSSHTTLEVWKKGEDQNLVKISSVNSNKPSKRTVYLLALPDEDGILEKYDVLPGPPPPGEKASPVSTCAR